MVHAEEEVRTDLPMRELRGVRPGADEPRIPEAPPEEVLEIPPMVERPFDPEAGDTVVVERFELKGVRDLPAHDITREAVRAFVDERLREQPDNAFTIGQLEQVAEAATNYYRERGLILARMVVPVQTVTDGVVTLELIEGRLGRILPEGNEMYADDTLRRPFRHIQGEPVGQQPTEAALLTLTDYPGVVAFGVFQPGQRVGETDMVLNVRNEERYDGEVRLDNHGTETTGEYRGRAVLNWNNPLNNADRLMVMAQQTLEPANSRFISLDYEAMFGRGYTSAVYGHANEFEVEDEDLGDTEVDGESTEYGLRGEAQLIRSRTRNLALRSRLAMKESLSRRNGTVASRDELTVLTLGADYDSVDTRFDGLNYFGLEYSRGFNDVLGAMGDDGAEAEEPPSRMGIGDNGREYAEGEFSSWMVYYTRVQSLTAGSTLMLRTEYQDSEDLLVPLEQYAVGGPDHVRSHPASYVMLDSAGLASLELILTAPGIADRPAFGEWTWGDLLQVRVFYDHAFGEINQPLPGDPEGQQAYSGAGVGLNFDIPGRLNSRLQLATPIEDGDAGLNAEPPDSLQVWADVTYQF
ncbi:MAG: ShlB/FhaC/HecB family hemolysin secretion/activation protein [Pseudomonadota bacterium]